MSRVRWSSRARDSVSKGDAEAVGAQYAGRKGATGPKIGQDTVVCRYRVALSI